jgi:hypothetical protein
MYRILFTCRAGEANESYLLSFSSYDTETCVCPRRVGGPERHPEPEQEELVQRHPICRLARHLRLPQGFLLQPLPAPAPQGHLGSADKGQGGCGLVT